MRVCRELPSSSRRRLLKAAWSLAAASICAPPLIGRALAQAITRDPFTLGVASGCPRPDGIVLWTRLAREPIAAEIDAGSIAIRWELARDEQFRDIVRHGDAQAAPQLAHSVHVELRGLEPDRHYWYRFMAGGATSPIGRTRTAPAASADTRRLRFAFASCQHFEQ